MKVLFITSTFPRNDFDSQVPWLSRLTSELKKKGIEPLVFAPSYKGLPSHTYHGIPIVRFRYAPRPLEILTHEEGAVFKLREHPWLSILAIFYLCFGLVGLVGLRSKQFDVVHVQWPFPNGIFGLFAKRLFMAKLILTFHGAEFTLVRKVPFGATILRYILEQSDGVIANSNFTRDQIRMVARVPVQIIPFASGVSSQKRIKRADQKGFSVLFVGRLIERKGVQYLIDAIKILRDKKITINLSIVGSGPLREELGGRIEKYFLSGAVKIYSEVDNKELFKFYCSHQVFVLPAIVDRWGDTEGLGVVLIEAMSFGIPVVASRVGGIPSIITHNKNGLLVPQKDDEAIVAALEKLYRDSELRKRLAESGYKSVRSDYNWKSIVDATMRLYRSV